MYSNTYACVCVCFRVCTWYVSHHDYDDHNIRTRNTMAVQHGGRRHRRACVRTHRALFVSRRLVREIPLGRRPQKTIGKRRARVGMVKWFSEREGGSLDVSPTSTVNMLEKARESVEFTCVVCVGFHCLHTERATSNELSGANELRVAARHNTYTHTHTLTTTVSKVYGNNNYTRYDDGGGSLS